MGQYFMEENRLFFLKNNRDIMESVKRKAHPGTQEVYKKNTQLEGEKRASMKTKLQKRCNCNYPEIKEY
jgi:hypothetical protein